MTVSMWNNTDGADQVDFLLFVVGLEDKSIHRTFVVALFFTLCPCTYSSFVDCSIDWSVLTAVVRFNVYGKKEDIGGGSFRIVSKSFIISDNVFVGVIIGSSHAEGKKIDSI